MSTRDLELILGYIALFGSVVLGLGYHAALDQRSPGQRSVSAEGASPARPVSSSDISQIVDRARR